MPTPSRSPITLDSTLRQMEGNVSAVVDGEVAIMSVEQGSYFTLNEVGGRIWVLLEQPRSLREVCETLFQEFDVEENECQSDVLELARELETRNLVERVHEPGK